jgi:hypothetical protein
MTKAEWLKEATAHQHVIESLLAQYHPANRHPGQRKGVDFITAPNAERTCTVVRKQIRDKFEGDPVKMFGAALLAEDVDQLMVLMNQAWFGVPESTTCWNITGFREMVSLLEDPPDGSDDEDAQ